jgi:Ser-tRNA(Ala) deacylase AlaX
MTNLLYLEDTYLYESTAKIKELREDEQGVFVVLDQTIFYPQGGGQPSDQGLIISEDSNKQFKVIKVLITDGIVKHYGQFTIGVSLIVGLSVKLLVDQNTRILNAKNHTAGHLLFMIVEKLYPTSKATKGYHFNDGAYVEFNSLPDNIDQKVIQEQLDLSIINSICIKTNTTKDLINNKPHRTMEIEGLGKVGCGGTHLANTNQLKAVTIRKIKKNRISYTLL